MSRVLKTGKNQITQGYSKSHLAVDLVKYENQADYITTHSDGTVVWVQTGYSNNKNRAVGNATYGNAVKIKHDNGCYTLYAHMKNVQVKVGDKVTKGQVIGYMSDSGYAFGVHLHFEIRDTSDARIDPTPYLDSELPNFMSNTITCEYRVYDNIKKMWLPTIKDLEDYAGIIGHSIGGFQLITHGGGITKLRAHILGDKEWLKEVVDGGFEEGNDNYVGIKGKPIDGIAIWSQYGDATYRVHLKNGVWLDWIKGKYAINDPNGYGGILGKEIDAIECYIK